MKYDDEYYRTHQRRGSVFNIITAVARILGLITTAGVFQICQNQSNYFIIFVEV